MELLGNKNTEYNKAVEELSTALLSSNNINAICTDLITVLTAALNKKILDSKTISLLFILDLNPEIKKIPIINNLFKELRLKYIRLQSIEVSKDTHCSNQKYADGYMPIDEIPDSELPESAKDVAPSVRGIIVDGKEQFIPKDGDFKLPMRGTTGNLTLTGIDYSIGKWVEREVIIDDEGYFVRQISYSPRDEDGINEIYSDNFLEALSKDKSSNDENSDTIKEAEDTCNTSGESAAETGVKNNN